MVTGGTGGGGGEKRLQVKQNTETNNNSQVMWKGRLCEKIYVNVFSVIFNIHLFNNSITTLLRSSFDLSRQFT